MIIINDEIKDIKSRNHGTRHMVYTVKYNCAEISDVTATLSVRDSIIVTKYPACLRSGLEW